MSNPLPDALQIVRSQIKELRAKLDEYLATEKTLLALDREGASKIITIGLKGSTGNGAQPPRYKNLTKAVVGALEHFGRAKTGEIIPWLAEHHNKRVVPRSVRSILSQAKRNGILGREEKSDCWYIVSSQESEGE